MRSQRLRRLALPGLVAFISAVAVRRALRSIGETLVPILRHTASVEQLRPLLGLVPALLALLLARWLWTRTARDHAAKIVFWIVTLIVLVASYMSSGGVTARGEFHGLLTPVPNSSFIETQPSRPRIRYDINAHGFRGPAWSVSKPANTFRIAIVGSSFVFGSGVEQEHTLSAQLARESAGSFPGRAVEVLNLGILGDGLVSHLEVVKLAHTLLDADVTVLCLSLPRELSRWDAQNERRETGRFSVFGLVSWALGTQTALFLRSPHEDQRQYAPEQIALLDEQLAALRNFRREHGARTLLVLGYQDVPERVRAAFETLPGVRFLLLAEQHDDYYLASDGHPSPAGNRAFAGVIVRALAVPRSE